MIYFANLMKEGGRGLGVLHAKMVDKINTYKLSWKRSEKMLGNWLANFNILMSYQRDEGMWDKKGIL